MGRPTTQMIGYGDRQRHIDGKTYKLVGTFKRKSEAQKEQRKWHEMGYYARVLPYKGKYGTKWGLYATG